MGMNNYCLVVILWFLAHDSKGEYEATEASPYSPQIHGDGKLELEKVFDYYYSQDFQTISSLADFVEWQLSEYWNCISPGGYGLQHLFVTDHGKQKLKTEWPNIWAEFELSEGVEP
jgi:hypothetical protein